MLDIIILGVNSISLEISRMLKEKCTTHVLFSTREEYADKAEIHFNTELLLERLLKRSDTQLQPLILNCSDEYSGLPELCAKLNAHLIDLTDTIKTDIEPSRSAFVLDINTIIASIGKCIASELDTLYTMNLRSGILPNVAVLPAAYALSTSGKTLLSDYFDPAYRIVNGELEQCEALDDHEELIVAGMHLEAFNTNGLGAIEMFSGLNNVSYKSLRYPGHLEFVQKRILGVLQEYIGDERFIQMGEQLIESLFPRSNQGVSLMAISCLGLKNGRIHEVTYQHKMPYEQFIAKLGFSVIMLLFSENVPNGKYFAGDLDYREVLMCDSGLPSL